MGGIMICPNCQTQYHSLFACPYCNTGHPKTCFELDLEERVASAIKELRDPFLSCETRIKIAVEILEGDKK
jgi:hypothetical protein